MVVWSLFANIDEFISADGKIIPANKVQMIQNLEGGIVKKITVSEGQVCKKGQVVAIMDESHALINYQKNITKRWSLELTKQRLEAELDGKKFSIKAKYEENIPSIARNQLNLFRSKSSQFRMLKQQLMLLENELKMLRPMVKDGSVAKIDLIRTRHKYLKIKGEVERYINDSQAELSDVMSELIQVTESINSISDKLKHMKIKSPIDGVVKQVYVNTIGEIIQAGTKIMEIVPVDDQLLVEAKVSPSDIGFIRVGQPALIKISAYDFTRFGLLKGKVVHISADSSIDKAGSPNYEVWVKTDKYYMKSRGKTYRLIPGMTVKVEMITGKRSVFSYFLSPFIRAKHNALSEN